MLFNGLDGRRSNHGEERLSTTTIDLIPAGVGNISNQTDYEENGRHSGIEKIVSASYSTSPRSSEKQRSISTYRMSNESYSLLVTPRSKNRGRINSFLETDRFKAYSRWKFHQAQQEKENPWLFRGQKVPSMSSKVPHVTIPESHRYTFAIVLRSTPDAKKHFIKKHGGMSQRLAASFSTECHRMRVKCIRRLLNSGLGATLLRNTYESRNKICILIDPYKDYDLLLHEYKRGKDELAISRGEASGRLGSLGLDDVKNLCFSPALENQLCHNIVKNAFRDYDQDEWNRTNDDIDIWDIVETVFPLHDWKFNAKFFREYRRRTFDFSMAKATTGNSERWAIEELRLHFGERVAFLFAFMHIYNKLLLPIMILCVLYYVLFRSFSGMYWSQYMRGLSIIGLGVAAIWGPGVVMLWRRETSLLVEKWNLKRYQETIFESNDENPNFQYVWVRNELTGEMEKKAKSRKRRVIRFMMGLFVLLCAILQCIFLVPFIQWYVFAKTAPVCNDCTSLKGYTCWQFLTCFNNPNSTIGTDRWLYILFQGILLGLTIDILFWSIFNALSAKFVEWENYEKKSEFENRLTHRRFLFIWSNWFFWFLFLAFIYLPYGNLVNDYIGKVLPWFATFQWDVNILSLDELFVTPLVVTQFLNLLLETVVPYLLRKWYGRPVNCHKCSGCSIHSVLRLCRATDEPPRNWRTRLEKSDMNAEKLAIEVTQLGLGSVPVLDAGDDSNGLNATEVIAESKLTVFDPMSDYLDAAIQFSYVLMFTVVWPLLPFPAFFNNILEVRGDAFRLLFAHRRPAPRRDVSIGEWATVLRYATYMGTIVTAGLIFVYHFGYWATPCNMPFVAAKMVPFEDVINQHNRSSYQNCTANAYSKELRLLYFLILEHFALSVRHLVLQADVVPSSINNPCYKRMKDIENFAALRSASSVHFQFIHDLRVVFDKHNVRKDDHLDTQELALCLAEWFQKPAVQYEAIGPILMKYMDKTCVGRLSFSAFALQILNIKHDRFLRRILRVEDYADILVEDSENHDDLDELNVIASSLTAKNQDFLTRELDVAIAISSDASTTASRSPPIA